MRTGTPFSDRAMEAMVTPYEAQRQQAVQRCLAGLPESLPVVVDVAKLRQAIRLAFFCGAFSVLKATQPDSDFGWKDRTYGAARDKEDEAVRALTLAAPAEGSLTESYKGMVECMAAAFDAGVLAMLDRAENVMALAA